MMRMCGPGTEKERECGVESTSPDQILWRIADVSAQLHDEQGDREQLLAERTRPVERARRLGLLRPRSESDAPPS